MGIDSPHVSKFFTTLLITPNNKIIKLFTSFSLIYVRRKIQKLFPCFENLYRPIRKICFFYREITAIFRNEKIKKHFDAWCI